jgi:hypothetical protein
MTSSTGENGSFDESLEILFWWLGDDPAASVEDELEDYLTAPSTGAARSRRRRVVSWPARRAGHAPRDRGAAGSGRATQVSTS